MPDRREHTPIWPDIAVEGLVKASAVEPLGLERHGDMIEVGDNLPPLNRGCVLHGPGNVGFTEIRQVGK